MAPERGARRARHLLDGWVVAAETSPEPVTGLSLRDSIRVDKTGLLAGRSRSPHAIGSGFASSMGAHTSAVYLEVRGRPRGPADLSLPLTLVDGTRAWLESLAPIRDSRDLDRFRRFLDGAERQLIERASGDPR